MSLPDVPPYRWFVACPHFIEPLLAEELLALGAVTAKVGHAGVQASGDLALGYRTLLWSRLASRVILQLAEGYASDQAELAALIRSVGWQDHLRAKGTFRVRFSGSNRDIHHTRFGAQWVKDQLVDYFLTNSGSRPSVSTQPDIVVAVNLHKGKASIGIELNRHGLHQRFGRDKDDQNTGLPANSAAAVLMRAGWPQKVRETAAPLVLIDPCCTDGSLLLEGALMALDMAPGLLHPDRVAVQWPGHDASLWETLLNEARLRREQGLQCAGRFIFQANYSSSTPRADKAAREKWLAAGLPEARCRGGSLQDWPDIAADNGLAITTLPFSEGQTAVVLRPLYQALGAWLARLPDGFDAALLAEEAAPLALTGLFYEKSYRLMLEGSTEYRVYTFGQRVQQERAGTVIPQELVNRLVKNLRKLKPFLRQGHTDAYRVYDADIPEYAIAVDRYGDWLHVQEYAPPSTVDASLAARRLQQALLALPGVLDVDPAHIVLKERKPQKGNNQYRQQGAAGGMRVVNEHGVRFQVNLTDYLDTGLFLDHRPMRYWLQQQAHGKRVLNLFCYTATASVHAAVGGASRVDSVDMSATYLEWARDNFRLNGFGTDPYRRWRLIQADVLTWVQACTEHYDLIFLDPPTFSNSKRMQVTFDVQRDHVALLESVMRLLDSKGTLVFSNNFRRFKLDAEISERYDVQDYRLQSLPADFARDPKIHGCWLIRHRQAGSRQGR